MDIYIKNREKVTFKNNVVINQKCVLDGDGEVSIGNRVTFGYNLAPHFYGFYELVQARTENSRIVIGDGTFFSNDIVMISNNYIEIGSDCLIGDRVMFIDNDAHEIDPQKRKLGTGISIPIKIGKNVWIGSTVTILKGVTIGNNSVIGCNSVVTHSIPENCIAAGNPARVIRKI